MKQENLNVTIKSRYDVIDEDKRAHRAFWLCYQGKMMILILGWPPSINHYWRRVGTRFYVCDRGIQYRKDVRKAVVLALGFDFKPISEPIGLLINAYPPDKRKRDLDNTLKVIGDSLEYARLIENDYQINELHIIRQKPVLGGKLEIEITVLSSQPN